MSKAETRRTLDLHVCGQHAVEEFADARTRHPENTSEDDIKWIMQRISEKMSDRGYAYVDERTLRTQATLSIIREHS
jgi:hypothetical protein